MKKYKPKLVKFVFSHKLHRGNDWKLAPEPEYYFGNRHTDTLNEYQFNQNHISMLFSDELKNDTRCYDKSAKFTENEAYLLLLKYLEDRLKKARSEKKRLDKMVMEHENYPKLPDCIKMLSTGIDYARTVNNRELTQLNEAVKIYRKKAKEILASKEYLWEQLLK